MSSTGKPSVTKYSKEFSVPPDFPDILRDLTREILRSQPKDINKFGESIFVFICSGEVLISFLSIAAYDYFSQELQTRQVEADENS